MSRFLSMRSARIMMALFVSALAATSACSAGTITGVGTGDGGTPNPTPTATATSTGMTDPTPPDSGTDPKPDASGPVIDKTARFDLTIDGQPITITKVTAKIDPASGNTPTRIDVAGQYEQQLGSGLTSTATFTVFVDTTETGTDACGTGGRDASYLFKDTDGSIRIESTGLQGGSCTMKIFSGVSDGFTSGSATGVIGGASQKSFTIAWGQVVSKS